MANDNISFLGVGRFRGYWNASTNSGTLTVQGGYDSDRNAGVPLLNTGSGRGASNSAGGFHTASSGGGDALTASAGDYFQISVAAATSVDSESGWSVNDYLVLKSGSAGDGDFKWVRLSYTDTVSSVVHGGFNSSSLSNALLDLSSSDKEILFNQTTAAGSSSFLGSPKLTFNSASSTMQLTGTLIVSGAVQANQFNTTVVETTILFKSGSTKFGDSSGDIHHFTGSVFMGHNLNVTGNIDANGTITCDDSITIDSVTITDTELAYLDGLTLGTVAASKVVTTDSNKDVAGFRNISGSGKLEIAGAATVVGALNVTGNADFNGTITCDDSITIDSVTITDTEIGYLDGLTLGTVAASKVVTVDSNKDFAGHRNMSGSGVLQNVGNAILGGNLNVSGTTTLAGGISGVISGSGNAQIVGTLETKGNVATSGSITAKSTITTTAGQIFINKSAGGDPLIGFLDGGNETWTIGTDQSDGDALKFNYDSSNTQLANDSEFKIASNGNVSIAGSISGSSTLVSVGSISSSGDLAVTGAVHANAFHGDGSGLSGVDSVSGSSRHYSSTGLETSGYLKVSGSSTLSHALPRADITYDLGSATKRWRNIYTGDLHLKNERGDWTVIEEEDFLTITNNKNGKRYKLLMEEI